MRIVVFILSLICFSLVQAQDLEFKIKLLDNDLYARTNQRLDLNNEPCAVIRVSAADIRGYVFEGSHKLGEVIYGTGEAIVYMARGARHIIVKNDKYGAFRYEFPENLRLESLLVYELRIIPPMGDFPSLVDLKFEFWDKDMYAMTRPRLDLNNVYCALIRVSAADIKSYVFEGNIIGDVIYDVGEALVYLPEGSKFITIKNDKYGTIRYDLPMDLRERLTYGLRIKLNEKALEMEKKR